MVYILDGSNCYILDEKKNLCLFQIFSVKLDSCFESLTLQDNHNRYTLSEKVKKKSIIRCNTGVKPPINFFKVFN